MLHGLHKGRLLDFAIEKTPNFGMNSFSHPIDKIDLRSILGPVTMHICEPDNGPFSFEQSHKPEYKL